MLFSLFLDIRINQNGEYHVSNLVMVDRNKLIIVLNSITGYKMPPYCVMQTHLSQNKSSEEFYKSSKIYFSEKKRRITDNGSFDINNIIIPYKVTSVTRIETPDYKEITTPK